MQITSLTIRNFMGARHIDLAPRTPITLIGGDNGQGKSSIQEAIRTAFSGKTLRVALKKEFGALVSDGAKTGSIAVDTDIGSATFAVPNGAHALSGDLALGLPDALPFVLNPQAFSALDADTRRTFLFRLTNSEVSEARVRKLLAEAGCAEDLVNETLPLLKSISGFPAAAQFAEDKAKDARGAWRGVTGAARYGANIAESWVAEKPEVDKDAIDAALAKRDETEQELREAQQALADLRARRDLLQAEDEKRSQYEQQASTLPRLRAKLEVDKRTLDDVQKNLEALKMQAGTAPRTGIEHELATAVEFALEALGDDPRPSVSATVEQLQVPFDLYVSTFGLPSNHVGDADARARVPEYEQALTTARNALANTERAIASATQAEAYLAENTITVEAISLQAITDAAARVDAIQAAYRDHDETLIALQMDKRKATEADEKTASAAKHQRDVVEWGNLADQLGPDGVPAQIVAQALRPFNTALRASAMQTGWRQPNVNPDMTITAEGRPYALLCESEQWRVNTMIAEAISTLSGVGMLVLDRMDVLSSKHRVELLVWLSGRVTEGALNSVFIFATLKQPALGMPETITCEWIREGELMDTEQIAAEFPALREKLFASASYRKAA